MNLLGFTYFNHAGPNDFVSFPRGGHELMGGKGLSGLLRPGTAVSVVPLGIKSVPFSVTERTQDRQLVTVTGELVVENVAEMRDYFDFSVFPSTGQYRNDPTAAIEDQIKIAVRSPLRAKLAMMTVNEAAANGTAVLEAELVAAVVDRESALNTRLRSNLIVVQSASVKSAVPSDRDVAQAIGASEREAVLTAQDDALAARRMQAAEKDREIRTFEEATALALEQARGQRIDEEGKNQVRAAEADAKATAKKLEPFANMDSGAVLAHAIMAAAEHGLDRVSIDPGLVAALRGVTE